MRTSLWIAVLPKLTTEALVCTTNEEASAWAENAAFYQNILSKPWVVSKHKQQQAKIEAEGLAREREARIERKQRKKELNETRERKAKRTQERSREKSHRDTMEKEEVDRAQHNPRKKEKVKTSRQQREIEAKQPARPIVSGNFDALGL